MEGKKPLKTMDAIIKNLIAASIAVTFTLKIIQQIYYPKPVQQHIHLLSNILYKPTNLAPK